MSVVQVQNEKIYFDNGIPTDGGINDLRMGTMDKAMRCATCQGGKIIFKLILVFKNLLVISVC
jgi:DNA-directed RNA polymerase beta' subunit